MTNKTIIYKKIETQNEAKALCIVAGFDARSVIQPYVFHLLESLQNELKADVVYVTTSNELSDADKEKISGMGVSLIHRSNEGYDFMSYAVGFECYRNRLSDYDRIYHVNDSIYGPFSSIEKICKKMHGYELDVWGMTDSYERKYHIQSYFVCFNKPVFSALSNFWDNYNYADGYKEVTNDGEIGLSQYLLKMNFSLGVAFPVEKYLSQYYKKIEIDRFNYSLLKRRVTKLGNYSISLKMLNVNPTWCLWRELLEEGYPFLKRKMLNDLSQFNFHMGEWLLYIDPKYEKAVMLTRASINTTIESVELKKPTVLNKIIHLRSYLRYKVELSKFYRLLSARDFK